MLTGWLTIHFHRSWAWAAGPGYPSKTQIDFDYGPVRFAEIWLQLLLMLKYYERKIFYSLKSTAEGCMFSHIYPGPAHLNHDWIHFLVDTSMLGVSP